MDSADADTADQPPRPVAFISHHSSQQKTARHLKSILERNGIAGWMAPDDIDPGATFDQAIIEQVRDCDVMVLLFCARSDQSDHVRREIALAVDHKKLIYPVRLEDIDAEGLAYWLSGYQWIDWLDRRDATIQRMVDTIRRQTDAPGAPAVGGRGFGMRRPRRRLIAASAVVVGIAALAAGLWFSLGGGEENYLKVRPGSWVRQMTDHEVVSAPGGEESARAAFAALGLDRAQGCIGAAESTDPGISFFDLDGSNNCSMDSLAPDEGSKIFAEFTCRPEALNGDTAVFALDVLPEGSMKMRADGNVTIRDGEGMQSLHEIAFHYYYSAKAC